MGGFLLKVLQVSPLFYPHVGGIERHVESLSNKLIEAGHDLTVYTTNVPQTKEYENINGLKINRSKCFFSLLNNQFAPGILHKLIKENDFDIIHVHSHLHMSSNMAALSRFINDSPMILTSHGVVTYASRESWKNTVNALYNRTAARWTLKSMDRIIALSPMHAELLVHLCGTRNKITVLPNWIDLSGMNIKVNTQKFKTKFCLEDVNVILFVGGLIRRKGINYLIASMRYVDPKAVLLVVGSELPGHNGILHELEDDVKKFGLKNVKFLGRLSDADLACAYAVADIVVLPSLSEGVSLTLLEAMAYKKCVVATNIAGTSDVIHHMVNGCLCKPANEVDLAKKISYMLENPDVRKKLGDNAHWSVKMNYDADIVINSIQNTYKSVISNYLGRKGD